MSSISNNSKSNNTICRFTGNSVFPADQIEPDILRRICSYLGTLKDAVSLALVNRKLTFLASDSQICTFFLMKQFPDSWAHFSLEAKDLSSLENQSPAIYKLLKRSDQNLKANKYRSEVLYLQEMCNHFLVCNGNLITCSAESNSIKFYDLNSRKELKKLDHPDVYYAEIHEKKLISESSNSIKVWTLEGKELMTIANASSPAGKLEFSTFYNNKCFRGFGDGTIVIWDLNT